MSKRHEIIEMQTTLKHLVAARRLKLADMAEALDVSIATAKRLLNGDDLSMERVLQICDWIGIRFHEMVEISTRRRTEYHYCSPEQESFLASRPSHFAFLRGLQKGESLDAIKKRFEVTHADCSAYLADLEQAGFLTLDDDGGFVLQVKDGMDWRPGGPLWQTFFARWSHEIIDHMADKRGHDGATVDVSQRKLSVKSFAEMRRELDELSRKYASISRLERELNASENLSFATCLILADFWEAPVWDVRPYHEQERR